MFGMSPMELMIIFLIVLLVFGAKRLPGLAKSMGKAIREFKGATEKMQEEFNVNDIDEPATKAEIPQKKNVDDLEKKEKNEKSEQKSSAKAEAEKKED